MHNRIFHSIIFIIVPFLFLMGCSLMSETSSDNNEEPDQPNQDQPFYWGVDSASRVTDSFYQCIVDNYGKPAAFGRYLGTKDGVSFGITEEEVSFLHERGIVIIPIYNHFSDATGYENGVAAAEGALSYAGDLGIEEGVYLFADIEPTYPVDSSFMQGWIETVSSSNYLPGIYGVFHPGTDLSESYQSISEDLQNVTAIWNSAAAENVTTKENRPEFNPNVPSFINVDLWQYGINGQQCNIDTNLIKNEMIKDLW